MNLFQELKENAREESLNEISKQAMIQKAIDIATSMGGNMTGAVKRIEKIKRNLSKDKNVANALRLANEETVSENYRALLEKAYDQNDVKKVEQLEKKLQGMLKEVEKTMKGSGLSAPAFNNVRSGIVKGLESIQKFYKIANTSSEETVSENYRVLAKHGMGAETKNSIKVGTEVDYYQKDGAKYMGKITKMTPKGYIVRDDKTKKDHEFTYHDRNAAKKLLKQGDNIQEKVEYAEYKFRNKRDAQKALDYFKSQQRIELDINDDGLSQFELAIDAGKNDMTKQHKEVLKKFKPKVLTTENATAQQAAIAIAKKKKNESVMDAYREMWEENLNEEMIVYKVKGMQKPEEQKFKGASRMGLKVSFKKSGSDTHVTLTGTKKNLRDFDAVARGKSSYGDPSTITHFDEK